MKHNRALTGKRNQLFTTKVKLLLLVHRKQHGINTGHVYAFRTVTFKPQDNRFTGTMAFAGLT